MNNIEKEIKAAAKKLQENNILRHREPMFVPFATGSQMDIYIKQRKFDGIYPYFLERF